MFKAHDVLHLPYLGEGMMEIEHIPVFHKLPIRVVLRHWSQLIKIWTLYFAKALQCVFRVCVYLYNKKGILIWISCFISPLPFPKPLSLFCDNTPKQKQVHYPLKILQMYIIFNFNNLLPLVKLDILELS